MTDYYATKEAVITTESDSSPDQLYGFLSESDARLVDIEVTIAEASFLAGPWSSETPWEPSDEGIDYPTRAPKNILRMASPNSSPSGNACCHG